MAFHSLVWEPKSLIASLEKIEKKAEGKIERRKETDTRSTKGFYTRKMLCEDILARLRMGESIPFIKEFVVVLPYETEHSGHALGNLEAVPEPIDKKLSEKIRSMVANGIVDVTSVKLQLREWVKCYIKPAPHPTNKRWYPSNKTLRTHVYLARWGKVKNDQLKVAHWVSELKRSGGSEDFVYFRIKGETTDDTTNRDIEAVKTNVDYQITGCFVTEDETIKSISEALSIIKHRFGAQPEYFMTDDDSEIAALEEVFPADSKVLICNFHREQAWDRWAKKRENSLGKSQDILQVLRSTAFARTPERFQTAVESLRRSDIYSNNSKFENYFEREWYPKHKRWSNAFRRGHMVVAGSTNGIERQHGVFKEMFMRKKTNYGLFTMLQLMVTDFFPSRYIKYIDANQLESGKFRRRANNIPDQLCNRPKHFIEKCLKNMERAKHVNRESLAKFHVSLGNEEEWPFCECQDWHSDHIPCHHICATMLQQSLAEWDVLSPRYL